MPLQENVPGVGTTAGPSWTVHDGNSVWLAWKGSGTDTGIYVSSAPSLQPNASSGQYSFTPQAKVLTLGTSASPAIASLNGTLYLFYKGASDNYIYWASSADGKTWVDKHLLALGDSLIAAANDQHPKTSAAPTVASANNCLYLFWKGASGNQIWWSASFNIGVWMDQESISTPGGTPETDASPAVALDGQTIHLAWKGKGANTIWWSTYSTPINSGEGGGQLVTAGPWAAQSEIFSGTTAAPALVCDGNGVVWLAWTGANGGVTYASLNSRNQWVGEANRLGIGSSDRPALISTGNDSTLIVMAWKGAGGDGGIYYGSMINPPAPAPPAPGLEGVSNYIICNGTNCQLLNRVVVTIVVTEPITCKLGFTIQLNANSPLNFKNYQFCSWQQCGFQVDPSGQLTCWVNNYTPSNGPSINTPDEDPFILGQLGAPSIPKGYKLVIALEYDGDLNVTASNFTVLDDQGNPTSSNDPYKIIYIGQPLQVNNAAPGALVTSEYLGPNAAFQINIVGVEPDPGQPNGSNANFTSGRGTITYTASNPLTASSGIPLCANSTTTGERSNMLYGVLPAYPGNPSLTQVFYAGNGPSKNGGA